MTAPRKPMHPRARLVCVLKRCEETIGVAEHWNASRAEEPLDCEPERIMADMARRGIAAWDRGDRTTFSRVCAEMAQYADRHRKGPQ